MEPMPNAWRYALLPLLVAGLLQLTSCIPGASSLAVDTYPTPPGSVQMWALATGPLRGSVTADTRKACFWFGDGPNRTFLVWPADYYAEQRPLRVFDSEGRLIGTVGQTLIVGGGRGPGRTVKGCGPFGSTWIAGWQGSSAPISTPTTIRPTAVPNYGTVQRVAIRFLDQTRFDALTANCSSEIACYKQPVAGLGDEAWTIGGPHLAEVIVRTWTYRIAIDVDVGLTEEFDPELKLAQLVVPKLACPATGSCASNPGAALPANPCSFADPGEISAIVSGPMKAGVVDQGSSSEPGREAACVYFPAQTFTLPAPTPT